jgi:hypothetical protein
MRHPNRFILSPLGAPAARVLTIAAQIRRIAAGVYALVARPLLTGGVLLLAALTSSPIFAAGLLLVPEHYTLEQALALAGPADTVSVAARQLDGGEIILTRATTLLSRESRANRIEALRLERLGGPVHVIGFHVGYNDLYGGLQHGDSPQGVTVTFSEVRFSDCLFQGLVPCGNGGCVGDGQSVPIVISGDSSVEFTGCGFRGNWTGGNLHGEAIAANCVVHGSDGGVNTGRLRFLECMFQQQRGSVVSWVPVEIVGSQFRNCEEYLITARVGLDMKDCLVAAFSLTEDSDCAFAECYGYTRCIQADGPTEVRNNTFVDTGYSYQACGCPYPTPQQIPALITLAPTATGSLTHNLFIGQPGAVLDAPHGTVVQCNDAFQSADAHYRGGIGDPTGVDGNISAPPIFCDRARGDYTISTHSPAAPPNSECGLMGAFTTACDRTTPVLVDAFVAQRNGRDVEVTWRLSAPAELLVRRFAAGGSSDVFRGQAASGGFVDVDVPPGELRYMLGTVQQGSEVVPVSWATVAFGAVPQRSRVVAAVPNPFNPTTRIDFEVGATRGSGAATERSYAPRVQLTIHDLAGRRIATLCDQPLASGSYSAPWHGRDDAGAAVASGVYVATLRIDGRAAGSARLALVR